MVNSGNRRRGGGMGNYGGGSNKLDMEEFEPLINMSTDLAVDVSTNLIREFMKKFIFTGHKCCGQIESN